MEEEENSKFPAITESILAMYKLDQEMRERTLDKSFTDEDVQIDRENTSSMQIIVSSIGWPTISKVGKTASEAAWLLVQHADHDIDFQKYCLRLMKEANPGEVTLFTIAYLEDRIHVNLNQNQLYGTQFNEIEGKFVPQPIEDLENVNKRRRSMGLGTLQEGIAHMYKKYNQKAPD